MSTSNLHTSSSVTDKMLNYHYKVIFFYRFYASISSYNGEPAILLGCITMVFFSIHKSSCLPHLLMLRNPNRILKRDYSP